MSDLQASLMYWYWIDSVPEELVRKAWHEQKSQKAPKIDVDQLKAIGYSDEKIAQILKELGQ